MKPPVGYGSNVSALRPARLVCDKTSTWLYSHLGLGATCGMPATRSTHSAGSGGRIPLERDDGKEMMLLVLANSENS